MTSKTENKKQEIKKKNYQQTLKGLNKVTDGLGLGIDPKIKKTVALLNLLGFNTSGSCEGHTTPTHGELIPWVDVVVTNKQMEEKIRNLVRAYWQYRFKFPTLSDMFNIVMYDLGKGPAVIRISAGAELFNGRLDKQKPKIPPVARKWLVEEGQKEMRRFTNYLWKRYMGEISVPRKPQKGIKGNQ